LLNGLVLESAHSTLSSFCEYARFNLPSLEFPSHGPCPAETKTIQTEIDDLALEFQRTTDEELFAAKDKIAWQRKLCLITHDRNLIPTVYRAAVNSLVGEFLDGKVDQATLGTNLEKYRHCGSRKPHEIAALASAARYLLQDQAKNVLSIELILKVVCLISGASGYRTKPAYVGAHLFPESNCIPNAMTVLVDTFNKEWSKVVTCEHAILRATQLMYEILALHPFGDGNGRLSRLLLSWALQQRGVPFCVDFLNANLKNHRALIVSILRTRISPLGESLLVTSVQSSVLRSWQDTFALWRESTN
jgi:hypothetical protein